LVWWPGSAAGKPIDRITVVGRPVRVLNGPSNARAIPSTEFSRSR
jgi:hypothetical protein